MNKKFIPRYNSKEVERVTLKKRLLKAGKRVAVTNIAGILLFSFTSKAQTFAIQTGSNNPYSALTNIGQINGNANTDIIRPEIADFSKDGLLDFLAVYNDVSGSVVSAKFHINTGTTTLPQFNSVNIQEYFFDLDIAGLTFFKHQNQAVADIDMDGDADILFLVKYTNVGGNYLCKIIYYENTTTSGTLSFTKNTSLSTINAITASNCPSDPNINALIGTADLNNDGVSEIYLFEHPSCGASTNITRYERSSNTTVNTYQLAVTNPVSGTFISDRFGENSTELEFADYDNDGDVDILLAGFFGGSGGGVGLDIFLNESSSNSSFSFAPGAVPQPINVVTLFNPYNPGGLAKFTIALKDLNNDGRTDISVGTTGTFNPAFPDQSRIIFIKSLFGTLPVILVSFTAQKNNKKIVLNWSTSQEQNSSHFEIERSKNGVQFEKIADVQAAGNSNIKKDYILTDAVPAKGLNYYRLKQIDIDGKFLYSPIRVVKFDLDIKFIVYPTVVKPGENLHINLQNGTARRIEIISLSGQILYSNGAKLSGNITIPLPATSPAGQYFIRVISDNRAVTQKIIIQ